MSAQSSISDARGLARKLVEHEKGQCGGSVERALYWASTKWGLDESHLRSLWKNRELKSVKGHVLDRLRQVDEILKARARREREILRETAESLERAGHPAAGLARMAAEACGEEG